MKIILKEDESSQPLDDVSKVGMPGLWYVPYIPQITKDVLKKTPFINGFIDLVLEKNLMKYVWMFITIYPENRTILSIFRNLSIMALK